MTRETWLLLDVSYLAYRNFYAMGQLSHDGLGTAIAYGILRDVTELTERYSSTGVVFAFDRGVPLRCQQLPTYKGKRREATQQDVTLQEAKREVHTQVKRLHRDLLPAAGYSNVISFTGYEADDIIASVCLNHDRGRSFVIVGSDTDLYQLLSANVSIWNPAKKKLLTAGWFRDTYGVSPSQWADVKAIAGCTTDNVPGVPGVGEKTAAKFLSGALSHGVAFDKIIKSTQLWQDNLKLVQLPFAGIPTITLQDDAVTPSRLAKVFQMLGINSLRTKKRVR